MELTSDKQYIIMQSDFDGKNMKPFLKNEDNKCFCQDKLLDSTSILHFDTTNIDKPLIYWTSKDRLIAADIYGCGCNLILSAGNQIKFNNLIIDKTNIYLYSVVEELIYILNKEYALLENKGDAFKYVQKIYLPFYGTQLTLDKTLQPYPPTICLTPNMKDYHVEKVLITANSIVVSLPEPVPNDGCEKYNLATTIYTISVSYLTCLDNSLNKLEEFKERTYKRTYKIQNLAPFTEYTLKLAVSNFYVDKLSMGLQYDTGVKLTTISGKLNAPEDVMVRVLTPTVAIVYWTPPKKLNCVAVNYIVNWIQLANNTETQEATVSEHVDNPERTLDGKFFKIIRSLLPGQKYYIFVSVYPTNNIQHFYKFTTDSLTKIVYMEPNNLIFSWVSTDSMNISLISSVNLMIHTGFGYTLEYKNHVMREWQIVNITKVNNNKITFYIKNLLPRTLYKFRLILKYRKHINESVLPDKKEFTIGTLGKEMKAL
ncbi:proto-oncogene tyrosine-protein kinase ros [Lasius niger]|uniref:Proto-oncogene tyrosine-protein kinase ros n=1 Tax=Lasius niger TaxID=67767 RepID=A0A0J7K5B8_LASNI|nr:proto-oncogene tyrosine-protein kinase ros [Lasius niger]